ncbi:TolC family protein [Rhodocyclus tenuis]|uniref:TolC family protein n=1 Tax=Rhodocyclus gracilis TaxID=2929842 RepID=A0ABX0WEG5_9RHOO|nr:TolC family protein [Rhodocyclus gracilis]NJA88122.1 TolC family protein [Rhodocyclus gracilis]
MSTPPLAATHRPRARPLTLLLALLLGTGSLASHAGAAGLTPATRLPVSPATSAMTASAGAPASEVATDTYPAELPPAAQAIIAVRQSPQVVGAQMQIDAEIERRNSLEAGPYEWTVRLGRQQRRIDSSETPSTTQRFREWNAALERPVRMPGKATLDTNIGDQGVAQARAAHADALHETARTLLGAWFVWLRESETARQWQQQTDSLLAQQQATARRVQLGDGARLELLQAEAAAAQARAALEQARRRSAVAAAELRARFPAIVLPTPAPIPGLPQPPSGSAGQWREHLLEHNHELRLARAETQQARLAARRSDAERVPDPTIGVHVGGERSGEERLTGFTLSIPLPGGARSANARRDTALVGVAAQREAAVTAKVAAEIASALAGADTAYAAWQSAENAARGLEDAARLTARARSLGEASLNDVLLAQRLANDARLAANSARLDAQEARCRLLLDTHQLWAYGDEGDEEDEGEAAADAQNARAMR